MCKLSALVFCFVNFMVFASAAAADQRFPALMDDYDRKTEIQKEPFIKNLINQNLSGSGFIDEVAKCGFGDAEFSRNCYKISIESGGNFAVVYFPEAALDSLSTLNKGDRYKIDNCYIRGFKDWGFWKTVYCEVSHNN